MAQITVPFNNYARVVSLSADGRTVIYADKTTDGMAQIGAGALIMFHVSKHIDSTDMNMLGKFILAEVLSDDGSALSLDTAVARIFDTAKTSKYNCQIVSIAQFGNLTINYNYNQTKAWDDTKKIGGLCAIACQGLLNLENGKINIEGKGGGTAYAREGLAFIGNAQMADILPLGQGHGSVFLLANEIQVNPNSRVGATYDGSNFGGDGGASNRGVYFIGGGYTGNTNLSIGSAGAGSGAGGGDLGGANHDSHNVVGGYGSNGANGGLAGAHIFIITNTLNEFNLANYSTGGHSVVGGYTGNPKMGGSGYGAGGAGTSWGGASGAAGGYNGGGGGYTASGGGSSGWCFIYVNEVKEFDMTGVII